MSKSGQPVPEKFFGGKPIRICKLDKQPPTRAPNEHLLVFEDLKNSSGYEHLTIDGGVLYQEGIKAETNVGMSFEIKPPEDTKWLKLFLKLAQEEKNDIGPTGYSRVKRHLSEEIENLLEVNELERSTKQVGHVAKVLANATLHYEGHQIPALLEEYVDGITLEEWLRSQKPSDITEEQFLPVWLMLAFSLTNIVRRLHNHGVIHGWIQPRHIILKSGWDSVFTKKVGELRTTCADLMNEVHLVGFGTSALLFEPERGESTRSIMQKSPFAAPEVKRQGRVEGLFSYPVDLFSLGTTLLKVALDMRRLDSLPNDPDELEKILRAETVERLKKDVADKLRAVGWTTESVARVVDKAIRPAQEDRFLCAEEMLQFILNAADAEMRKQLLGALLPLEEVKEPIKSLGDHLIQAITGKQPAKETTTEIPKPTQAAEKTAGSFLPDFFKNRIYETSTWQGLSAFNEKSHLEVYGSRDVLLDWLCAFMGLLQDGDQYCTRTIPAYWTDNNLGATGRFLVKNKDLAMNGVVVKRLFIVAHKFDELAINEQMALLEQRNACNEVWKELEKKKKPRTGYDVRVIEVPEIRDLLQVERRRQFVAYVKFGTDMTRPWSSQQIGFSFMSHGGQYQEFDKDYLKAQITKLRFRSMSSEKGDDIATKKFETDWETAPPLDDYLKSGSELKDMMKMLEEKK